MTPANTNSWYAVSSIPVNQPVETKISDASGERNFAVLTYRDNLFWGKDGMYVYYRPTHWRHPS